MEYKGKLYGHLGGKMYFDTGKTADDWDALEKRVAELEAENQALRQLPVVGRSEQLFCGRNVTTCIYFDDGKCNHEPSECKDQVAK